MNKKKRQVIRNNKRITARKNAKINNLKSAIKMCLKKCTLTQSTYDKLESLSETIPSKILSNGFYSCFTQVHLYDITSKSF
jgi:hypothetical protein